MFKLSSESQEEINVINNIVAECNLSVLHKISIVAKSSNNKFKNKVSETMLFCIKVHFSNPGHLAKKMMTLFMKHQEDWKKANGIVEVMDRRKYGL